MTSTPRYLVRFDDLCPTTNWEVWNHVESVLVAMDVRPLVSVVPDNRDEALRVAQPAADFWDRVRAWRVRGWSIAMHGYRHLYVTSNGGLLGINRYSEFAGLPEAVQAEKIRSGLAIFRREGITADAWTAPAHSFDAVTLKVLADHGLRLVSDGFTRRPFTDGMGLLRVPQQLCDFAPCRSGVWTVCLHGNSWSREDLGRFERNLAHYRPRIAALPQIVSEYKGRPISMGDLLHAYVFGSMRWSRFPVMRLLAGVMCHGTEALRRSRPGM
ncbi:MAG: DUF2334 domain-containing protein [Syntrophobacter sp.]